MFVPRVKKMYNELPATVRSFLWRAILLFAGWLIIYNLVLKPANVPDSQLTKLVTWAAAKTLSLFYVNVHTEGQNIFVNGQVAVGIANQCNGLELIMLYLGFLLCLPTSRLRTIVYAVVGTITICIMNIIRCSVLAFLFMSHNYYADFAHHYAFKLIVYAAVFAGWIGYSKKTRRHEELPA